MNERLREIRKALSLSQEAFGKKLGITGAGVSKIESGDRNLTEQMILAVCREFNVNEKWLRNGNGDMFLDFTEAEFARSAAALSSDSFVRSLITEYLKLDDDGKKLFRDFIHRLSDNMKEQDAAPQNITAAEAAYEKSLGIAPSAESSALNTTDGTDIPNADTGT